MERINAMGERTRRTLVQHLNSRTPHTITELIAVTGFDRGTIYHQLRQLQKLNLVKAQRYYMADRGTRYWLTKTGEDMKQEWRNENVH